MTTLLVIFLTALAFSLALTPLAGRLGVRLGAVDMPAPRKVHATPIPRIGGLAVFLAFAASMLLTSLYGTQITDLIVFDRQIAFRICGALVVFGCGLWDDFRRLNAWIKLLFQILGATIAFAGGVSIGGIFFEGHGLQFGVFSYAVTVFWFLLFINAVNLIDGLDGLAAGLVFFTSLLIVVISVMRGQYLPAVYFAAISGATLGFLRYNFNPATVFLGDGGSYFLGYVVAELSIVTSLKSQVGALMLIPLLALGVPVFDTILSPLRRWVRGRKIFRADNGHIHHKLLAMGLSSRNTVLILYGATVALCVFAIVIVNLRSDVAGLILVIVGAGTLILMRKAGYLEYFVSDKLYGWLRDVTDEAGFSRGRRTFLSLQMDMNKARTLRELCAQLGEAMKILKFERAELHLKGENKIAMPDGDLPAADDPRPPDAPERRRAGADTVLGALEQRQPGDDAVLGAPEQRQPGADAVLGASEQRQDGADSVGSSPSSSSPSSSSPSEVLMDMRKRGDEIISICALGNYRRSTDVLSKTMFKIDLPLDADGSRLFLMKDLSRDPLEYYTLHRLEHLRRSFLSNLSRLRFK